MVIALSLGAVLLALLARALFLGYPSPPAGLRVLTRQEHAIVSAAADALFPKDGPIPLSGTEAGVVAYTDASLAVSPLRMRALIHLLFFSVEHGAWLFGPRRARFTRLSQAERIRSLEGMARSRLYFRRVSFLSLRTLMCIAYLANERVADAIGMKASMAPFDAPADAPPAAAGLAASAALGGAS